ncbi:MAG: ATP-dependent DNA ligase [Hadesarchaea archaeon]|nr:ATP-dependent DNA ligase [Hadesarchaea archaeon]MDH5686079.1 ATP-dependent DNA ligase [Hadesarchaea archaeon]
MRYTTLAEAFEKLEHTPSYLEKNSLIVDLLKRTPAEEMERVVLFLLGRPWPAYVSKETGVGLQQLKKAIVQASGYSPPDVDKLMKQVGDLGEVAEQLSAKKKQVTLFTEQLTVKKVFENIKQLPEITGEGSVDRKIASIAELLTSSTPLEAKFVVRTVIGDLRIGVAEGRLRDAIASAFNVRPEVVEYAYMLTTDYSIVAKAVATGGEKGLEKLGVIVGHPVNPMLAQRAETIDEVLERMKGKAAFEIKLDGIRVQVHKDGDKVSLFTRRMEDYTNMFPDLVDPLRQALKPKRAIVDGELVAIDKRTGKPMPFQEVLKRRRKYEIKQTIEQIPVELHLFDVLVSNDSVMLDDSYVERRKMLEKIVKPVKGKVMVVEQQVLSKPDEIKKFMNWAIEIGHEGLLAKDLEASYRAGRREFVWLKLKPMLETLDLVVVGGLYGKGKRAGFFGSYVLAARDEKSGKFKTVTKCGSGYTDEDLKELTKMFEKIQLKKPHEDVDIEIDCDAYFEPKIVFEMVYEEIQKSPELKHTSTFGLRFPRYIRIREDRRAEEANTIKDIEDMYERQQKRKAKV